MAYPRYNNALLCPLHEAWVVIENGFVDVFLEEQWKDYQAWPEQFPLGKMSVQLTEPFHGYIVDVFFDLDTFEYCYSISHEDGPPDDEFTRDEWIESSEIMVKINAILQHFEKKKE